MLVRSDKKKTTLRDRLVKRHRDELMNPQMAADLIVLTRGNKLKMQTKIESAMEKAEYFTIITVPSKATELRMKIGTFLGIVLTKPVPDTVNRTSEVQQRWIELATQYLHDEGFTVEQIEYSQFLYNRLRVSGWI